MQEPRGGLTGLFKCLMKRGTIEREVLARAGVKAEEGGYTIPYFARSLSSMSPKASHGQTTVMSVPRPSMPGISSPNPFWPGLGALLLKVRVVLCLNLGGAFLSAGAATASAISFQLLHLQ